MSWFLHTTTKKNYLSKVNIHIYTFKKKERKITKKKRKKTRIKYYFSYTTLTTHKSQQLFFFLDLKNDRIYLNKKYFYAIFIPDKINVVLFVDCFNESR